MSARAHHRSHKVALRAAIKKFKRDHFFVERSSLGITGVFEDRKDGGDRVIILHEGRADLARLRREAARYFGAFPWKLVKQSSAVRGTVLNGSDLFHDPGGGHGTVGAWLRDARGVIQGLSNDHVIAALGHAQVGDPVFSAGKQLGTLTRWLNLKPMPQPNFADAALFKLNDKLKPEWAHPRPQGETGVRKGLRVYKVGAQSGLTRGTITGVNGALNVELSGERFHFEGLCAIQGAGEAFSQSGDSGALVMTQNHFATAVLFAKAEDGSFSYAFPLGAAARLLASLSWA